MEKEQKEQQEIQNVQSGEKKKNTRKLNVTPKSCAVKKAIIVKEISTIKKRPPFLY